MKILWTLFYIQISKNYVINNKLIILRNFIFMYQNINYKHIVSVIVHIIILLNFSYNNLQMFTIMNNDNIALSMGR